MSRISNYFINYESNRWTNFRNVNLTKLERGVNFVAIVFPGILFGAVGCICYIGRGLSNKCYKKTNSNANRTQTSVTQVTQQIINPQTIPSPSSKPTTVNPQVPVQPTALPTTSPAQTVSDQTSVAIVTQPNVPQDAEKEREAAAKAQAEEAAKAQAEAAAKAQAEAAAKAQAKAEAVAKAKELQAKLKAPANASTLQKANEVWFMLGCAMIQNPDLPDRDELVKILTPFQEQTKDGTENFNFDEYYKNQQRNFIEFIKMNKLKITHLDLSDFPITNRTNWLFDQCTNLNSLVIRNAHVGQNNFRFDLLKNLTFIDVGGNPIKDDVAGLDRIGKMGKIQQFAV